MKLKYAPVLQNKQPGFYKQNENNLKIILVDNQAQVLTKELKYIVKIIDGYSSNIVLNGLETELDINNNSAIKTIQFILAEEQKNKLEENEYYRIQVAYKYGKDIGPYSNVAIFKTVNLPVINLEADENNLYQVKLIYSSSSLNSEKIAKVQFSLYQNTSYEENVLLERSDSISWSNAANEMNYQFSYYTVRKNESFDTMYLCAKADYETVDGYTGTVNCFIPCSNFPQYIDNNDYLSCIESLDNEGMISLNIKNFETGKKGKVYRFNGNIILKTLIGWEYLGEITSHLGDQFLDKNIISGQIYNYLIVIDNKEIIFTNIQNYFEDMYLFDKNTIFKIKYNPKVTSFKQIVQEQKIETIGSTYPFICRNGNLKYHEFSLGGLISYIPTVEYNETYTRDEYKTFTGGLKEAYNNLVQILDDGKDSGTFKIKFKNNEGGTNTFIEDGYSLVKTISESEFITQQKKPEAVYSTNLTDENISRELNYKKEVLNWLNNGKPKVFKSPKEGTYIVRLMNISLSPEDNLGRMLHSFTCTATEIADCNMKNLKKYELI